MRHTFAKQLTVLVLALILILAMASCGSQPSDDGSDINTVTVTMNILYPEEAKKQDLENFDMQVQEDATVMQILESYSNQEGIPIEVDTSSTPYVTSINQVSSEGSSGWIYEINDDTSITKGASDYKVKDGDKIFWKYVTF